MGCLRTTNLPFDCFAGFGTLMVSYKRRNEWLERLEKQACEDASPTKNGDFPASHVRDVEQKICEVAEKKAKQVIIRW